MATCNDNKPLDILLKEYLCAELGNVTNPAAPQIDVENITICKNGTWHYITKVFTNGVETSSNETDTGEPCEGPQPIPPVIEDIEVCDGTTNTIHVIVNQYTYPDPSDLTNVVVNQLNDIDTNVACNQVYVSQRTATCITDVNGDRFPKYVVDWSDGTQTFEDPTNGEDNWCECG